MLTAFYQMSDTHLFFLLSCLAIIISIWAVFIVRRFVPLDLRYQDNPVIGNVGSLISIIYGVLVGLTALYLINNISYTSDAVQREANAVADIYRDSKWLKEPARSKIQDQIKRYLDQVVRVEWPAMQRGEKIIVDNDSPIEIMSQELDIYGAKSPSELLIMQDMVSAIRMLYDAREQRIHMSYSALSPQIWIVIIIGTILTLIINYIFGMNFYLHLLTVTAVALMASSMLYLVITLEKPFQGDFVVEPSAFQAILDHINKQQALKPQGS